MAPPDPDGGASLREPSAPGRGALEDTWGYIWREAARDVFPTCKRKRTSLNLQAFVQSLGTDSGAPYSEGKETLKALSGKKRRQTEKGNTEVTLKSVFLILPAKRLEEQTSAAGGEKPHV